MKAKSNKGIYTLADVQRRKCEIAEKLEIYEEKIQESYYSFTHPFSAGKFFGRECTSGNEDIYPKIKRIISIASTAVTVYNLIKKFRSK